MDISGSHRIPAPRAAVWAALQDVEALRACLPGCDRLERAEDGVYRATVATKVGPIRTAISGEATLSALERPARFAIAAKGADPAAGGGEGSGEATLEEDGDGTILSYAGAAEAHGKISQLGQRLLTGVFRKTVEQFCENLSARLAAGELSAEPLPVETAAPPLVHEEPAEAPATVLDAPPLSPGVPGPAPDSAIAPTATPDVPDPAALAAANAVEAGTSGASVTTRVMLVAAVVVAIGALVYYMVLQAPPPA